MRFQFFLLFAILISAFALSGCPSGGNPPANSNTANAPAANVTNNSNSDSSLATNRATPDPTNNDAPTLKPVFKAYCDAKTKNDEAGLRKVYSQATLKQFEADMKAEGVKTLTEYLEIDQVSNKLCEIRNEKIEGDSAIAEVKTEGTPNGFKVKFVKENGEWKLTNESPEIPKK